MEMSESKQTVIKVPYGIKSIVEQFAKKTRESFQALGLITRDGKRLKQKISQMFI